MAALTIPALIKGKPVLGKHLRPLHAERLTGRERALTPAPHDPTPKPWMRKTPKKTINPVSREDKYEHSLFGLADGVLKRDWPGLRNGKLPPKTMQNY